MDHLKSRSSKNATFLRRYSACLILPAFLLLPPAALADVPMKQAKFIIEHNATDSDTGFQIFLDADGWEKLQIIGPAGLVAEFLPKGPMSELGMTELFLESVEPANVKVPLAETLKKMPEGEYQFIATASKLGGVEGQIKGKATLSHKIPDGVTLVAPAEDETVPLGNTNMIWKPSNKTINGSNLNIIAYQLIVEKDEEPHKTMIGKRGLSMYLPASTTSIEVDKVFFEAATSYKWEVLAIEESGNQTLQSGSFKTQ